MDQLPKVRSSLQIAQLPPERFESIRPVYREFAHRHSGMNTREHERFWPDARAEQPWTVYVAGDPIEAYVVVRLDSAFWVEQRVRELIWLTPAGYDAMLELFRGIAINQAAVRWDEPSNSPLAAAYMDYGVELKLCKPVMYRVLDVRSALEALRPNGSGAFRLGLDDALMPDNVGPWLVEYADGAVSVQRDAGPADLEMDVRRFAQALLGAPSLGDLLCLGYASARTPEGADAALRLLPPSHTTCLESF
jgi:predicted acetyltransferase